MALNPTYIVVNQADISQDVINLLLGVATEAFSQWGAVLAGDADISVRVELLETTSSGRAQGGWANGVNLGIVNGVNLIAGAPAYELQTGQNLSGGTDILLQFSRDYLLNELFLDPSPAQRGDVPANRTDGLSVLLHEIGHALGVIGYYNTDTNQQGSVATTYDLRRLDIGGEDFFRGPNTQRLLGADLELTRGNYTHYGNSNANPATSQDPLTGLMNGVVFYRGFTYSIGELDLALLADLGLGTIRDDVLDNPAHDYLRGGLGNDTITGGDIVNHLFGEEGDDALFGAGANDLLSGGQGDDTIHGGSGIDTATYAAASGRVVVSLLNQGAAQGTRAGGLDILVSIENLDGSAFGDWLFGNDNANHLTGGEGDDRLLGNGGGDTLAGGPGNDRLDGGLGSDTVRGGAGNDIYYIDDALDTIVEQRDEGEDTVWASRDIALGANLENLQLLYGDLGGIGNAQANIMRARGGDNVLSGGGGGDALYGGTGRDALAGGDGADRLSGEAGMDTLTGGTGADRFVFEHLADLGTRAGNADIITDFSRADGDRINLAALDADAGSAGDQAFRFIGTALFSGTAGEMRYYSQGEHTVLTMDTDGDGAADIFLRFDGQVDLVASAFYA